MKDESKLPYLYVPDYLHAREDLSAAERDVLGTIVALSKDKGYCYAKNLIFTKVACVKTIRGAQYILAKLKNKELINVEVKRYKKSEMVEGKSKFGTVRKIYLGDDLVKQSKLGMTDRPHEESFMGGMQVSSHNIVKRDINSNNYLEDKTRETSYKEEKPNTGPLPKTRNEVVFRVMIKKIRNSLLNDNIYLNENNIKKSEMELAKKALLYYLAKYEAVIGEEHPRYKQEQVYKCYVDFIIQAQILRNYGWSLEYVYGVFRQVLNRWFSSMDVEKNKLRLNHYFGKRDNKIFFRCLEYVGLS